MLNDNFEKIFVKGTKVHIMGIFGVSMSAIATILQNIGCFVTGCDKIKRNNCFLDDRIIIYNGHDVSHIKNVEVVVYSSAINGDNEELQFARECKKIVLNRAETLCILLKDYKNVIGISGSHGKTTSTSMLTHIFSDANLFPTAFIGGYDKCYGNFLFGKNDYAIIESCEYKKNFLYLGIQLPIVLNIDNDHLDSYSSFNEIVLSFKEFCSDKFNFINADDKYFSEIKNNKTISFGVDNGDFIRATNLKNIDEKYSFDVLEYGIKFANIKLKIVGKYNIYNALSAITVARFFGIPYETIKKSLENFDGVERRNQYIGNIGLSKCFTDYAHHPTELKELIDSIGTKKDKVLFVFQPHTYSRTENLFCEFVGVLSNLKNVVIFKTYGAREKYTKNGSGKRLFQALKNYTNCIYIENRKQLKEYIKQNKNFDYIYFVGAGDIYNISVTLLDNK